MPPIQVNADNFARAESDRMFNDLATVAGGVNRWNGTWTFPALTAD